MAETVLERLIEYLRARDVALDGQLRPAAILWTDPKAEWRPLIPLMLSGVEELLVLGDYAPERRTGPAIWIRCLVDGALREPALPGDRAPVVYLPGVARQELRAGEECPRALQPLVELMFRGTLWLQHNGSDWGVSAFLGSSRGLGLDIARDHATLEALLRALPEVATTPVAQLAGTRLQADDFDRLLSGDAIRDLLRWMGDGNAARARMDDNAWAAFRSQCRDQLGFDPETDVDVTAGELLGKGEGAWAAVWERFAESPGAYGDVAGLLMRSRPTDSMAFDRHRWPDLNEEDEQAVRTALAGLPALPHGQACDVVRDLEQSHGKRRGWVWARLGQSPMAEVLEPLSRLADGARAAIGGATPEEAAEAYADRGWQVDAAAWEALARCPTADEETVAQVVRHLLQPWLEDSARAFQDAVDRSALPGQAQQPAVEAGEDECVVFADGLRYDLAQRLTERLEGRGCRVSVGRRWAAVPTVTATAKPAVTPVSDSIVGETLGEYFATRMEASRRPADAQNLRTAIGEQGYQVLDPDTFDAPMSHPARGWLETGEIDSLGHKLGARFPRQIDAELDRLAERVTGLLDAGWKTVRVVTDHGWLLLPGGLPKVDLPRHLTESCWSRCAVIAGESSPEVRRAAWYWNASQHCAVAPGIACYNRSDWYAHGGLSVQECLIPDLQVERSAAARVRAAVASITWRGLRCFIEIDPAAPGITADLRLARPSGRSVAASPKAVEADGAVSLVLGDDTHEEDDLVVVLLDASDAILSHRPTRVGADT